MSSEHDAWGLEMTREFGVVDVVEVAKTLVADEIAVNEGTVGEVDFALFAVRKPLGEDVGKAKRLFGHGRDEVERDVGETRGLQMGGEALEEIVRDAGREAWDENVTTRAQSDGGVDAKFAWDGGKGGVMKIHLRRTSLSARILRCKLIDSSE